MSESKKRKASEDYDNGSLSHIRAVLQKTEKSKVPIPNIKTTLSRNPTTMPKSTQDNNNVKERQDIVQHKLSEIGEKVKAIIYNNVQIKDKAIGDEDKMIGDEDKMIEDEAKEKPAIKDEDKENPAIKGEAKEKPAIEGEDKTIGDEDKEKPAIEGEDKSNSQPERQTMTDNIQELRTEATNLFRSANHFNANAKNAQTIANTLQNEAIELQAKATEMQKNVRFGKGCQTKAVDLQVRANLKQRYADTAQTRVNDIYDKMITMYERSMELYAKANEESAKKNRMHAKRIHTDDEVEKRNRDNPNDDTNVKKRNCDDDVDSFVNKKRLTFQFSDSVIESYTPYILEYLRDLIIKTNAKFYDSVQKKV